MADNVKFDLSGLADFEPFIGIGSADHLSHDGSFSCLVTKWNPDTAKSGKAMALAVLIVQDADNKGKQLLHNINGSGVDSNGKAMVRQFGELLYSVGFNKEQIRSLAARGLVDAEKLGQIVLDKTVYVYGETSVYQGKVKTEVKSFITKEAYEEAIKSGSARKPHRQATQQVSAPGGTGAPAAMLNLGAIGGPGAPAAQPNGALAALPPMNGGTAAVTPAADPLSRMAGMKLPI